MPHAAVTLNVPQAVDVLLNLAAEGAFHRVVPLQQHGLISGLWATEDGLVFFGADAFFGVRVAEPRVDTGGQEALERSVITGYRWWTTAGLRATGDRIVPYGLSDLVDRLVSDGVPATPVRLPPGLGK